jgi:hypothetical protein
MPQRPVKDRIVEEVCHERIPLGHPLENNNNAFLTLKGFYTARKMFQYNSFCGVVHVFVSNQHQMDTVI